MQEEPWVDMSEFEDGDPEEALSDADLERLRGALAVDHTEEPSDALWEHMLATAVGGTPEQEPLDPEPDPEPDPVGEEVVDDPLTTHPPVWDAEPPADDSAADHDIWHHQEPGLDYHGDGP